LVVDDDVDMADTCRRILEKKGLRVLTASNGPEALESLKKEMPDLVLSDVRMPGMEGSALLKELKSAFPQLPVILMTGFGTIQSAVEALRAGAADYITKPFTRDDLVGSVGRALELKSLRVEVGRLRGELENKYSTTNIIGHSKSMQVVFQRIQATQRNDATVLITGENGTGKDLVARGIHYGSTRAAKPFIPVNCGALPRELIESELFGHKKGSFTGASADNRGMFRAADGGTIFLDEIAEMPLDLQVKLLRALQERKVRSVGDTTEYPVDVRVIAATNRDLSDLLNSGVFRQDLYYRLSVVSIHVPALRERIDDIPLLLKHFVDKHDRDGRVKGFTQEAMRVLERYPWPGNVRELENMVEGLIALGAREQIDVADLGERFTGGAQNVSGGAMTAGGVAVLGGNGNGGAKPVSQGMLTLEEAERQLIEDAIQRCGGNKSKAASLLGISRTRLYRKLGGLA
jgi:two-component system NtrC family response regulator